MNYQTRFINDPDLNFTRIILHIVLLVSTFISCSLSGATITWQDTSDWWNILSSGFFYSIPLILILFAHEMGHYMFAQKYSVLCTLPYFIPVPISLIGTMGAFIRMKSPVYDKKALFDIGIAGPLAGFIVSTIFILWGLPQSQIIQTKQSIDNMISISLGDSLLFKFFSYLLLPDLADGFDIMLSPMAFAGWLGYLITAINLMPVGQLDGGHIIYALLGEKFHYWISRGFYVALIPLSIYFYGWAPWLVMLLILGINHPPVIFSSVSLGKKRSILGYGMIVIFFLIFVLKPFNISF